MQDIIIVFLIYIYLCSLQEKLDNMNLPRASEILSCLVPTGSNSFFGHDPLIKDGEANANPHRLAQQQVQ